MEAGARIFGKFEIIRKLGHGGMGSVSLALDTVLGRKVDAPGAAEGLQATVNLAILAFGALWFLITAEQRLKRRRILNALFELRAFAHVIDMHQVEAGIDEGRQLAVRCLCDDAAGGRRLDVARADWRRWGDNHARQTLVRNPAFDFAFGQQLG